MSSYSYEAYAAKSNDDIDTAMPISVDPSGRKFTSRLDQSFRFPMKRYPKDIALANKSLHGVSRLEDWVIPSSFREPALQAELTRLKHLLIFYRDKVPEKYMSVGEILHRTINDGPDFAAELTDLLKYSQRRTFNLTLDEQYMEYPELLESIDYIFDPKCLLKWDNHDDKDYLLMGEPRKKVDESIIRDVLDELDQVCSGKSLRKLDILDYMKWFSRSKVVDDFYENTTTTNFEYHSLNDIEFTADLKFRRALIWKSPGESRDALVCDGKTLHTLSRASQYLGQIGRFFPEYVMHKDFDPYVELRKLRNKTFLLTDLKKCGLTFPRNLFIPILRRLDEIFPECGFSLVAEGYDRGPIVMVDGKIFHTNEGVGLGMLNELVTLAMVLIYRVGKSRNILPSETVGWFFNDDQLIYWERDLVQYPENYMQEWLTFLRAAGYTVHEKKPFHSNEGQFCEQWTKTSLNMEKRVRQYHILLSPLVAQNICVAKVLFSQQYMRWWGLDQKDNENALSILLEWWGYEFHPSEVELPLELGGWVSFRVNGLNQALLYLLREDCPLWAKRLWYHYKPPQVKWRPWVKEPKTPSILKELSSFTEDHESIFSFKKKIQGLLERSIIVAGGKDYTDSYNYKYNKQLLYNRQATQKLNCPNYEKLVEEVNSREYNNYSIPLCSIQVGNSCWYRNTLPAFDITPCEDLQRLWLSYFTDIPVSAPESGDLTSFFSMLISKGKYTQDFVPLVQYLEYRDLPKLVRFGTNTRALLNDLVTRVPRIDISIIGKDHSLFKEIESRALGKGRYLRPYQGNVWKIDDPDDFEKPEYLLFSKYILNDANCATSDIFAINSILSQTRTSFQEYLKEKERWIKGKNVFVLTEPAKREELPLNAEIPAQEEEYSPEVEDTEFDPERINPAFLAVPYQDQSNDPGALAYLRYQVAGVMKRMSDLLPDPEQRLESRLQERNLNEELFGEVVSALDNDDFEGINLFDDP
jgi:hypothetical protein